MRLIPLHVISNLVAILGYAFVVPGSTAQTDPANTIEVPANIQPLARINVVSRIDGYVEKVHVDIGDSVKKNQVLIRLKVPELKADVVRHEKMVLKAQADLESDTADVDAVRSKLTAQDALTKLRESELERIKRLVASGALREDKQDEAQYAYESVIAATKSMKADLLAAQAKLASSHAAIEVAGANLVRAQAMAGYLDIRAAFDGEVTRRNVDPGSFVRPPSGKSSALLEIMATHKLRVVLMLSTKHAAHIKNDLKVEIHSVRGLGDRRFQSSITRHSKAFNPSSRMLRAEVELDNPMAADLGRRILRPGDYGKATIFLP